MRLLRKLILLSALSGFSVGTTQAQQIEPTSVVFRKNSPVVVPYTPCCPTPAIPSTTTDPAAPSTPQPGQQDPNQAPPDTTPFNEPSPGGTSGVTSGGSDRPMIGDFAGYCVRRTIFVPQTSLVTTTTTTTNNFGTPTTIVTTTPVTTTTVINVCDPVAVRAGSGFKVADNGMPRPEDRAFITYNYYSNMQSGDPVPAGLPGSGETNLHRQVFGFDKTFLDGDASLGLRIPFFQTDGGFSGNDVGDVSIVGKWALENNRQNGDVWSVGLSVTAPTGPSIQTAEGALDSWLLQPFTAWIMNDYEGFYLLGFHSLVVPTDSRDVVVVFNDISTGYVVYQANAGDEALLTSVTPTVEIHVTTPLNNRSGDSLISVSDIVSFTAGSHFGIGERGLMTLGVNVPVTGPQPYDVEAVANFNFRF